MYRITIDYDLDKDELLDFLEDFKSDEGRYPTEKEVKKCFKDMVQESLNQGDLIDYLNQAKIKIHLFKWAEK